MKIKYLKAIAFTVCLLSYSNTVLAENNNAANYIASTLAKITTMHAAYKQQLFNKNSKLISSENGSILLKKPGMFKITSHSVSGDYITISNGQYTWQYDQELSQAIKTKNTTTYNSPIVLLLTTGEGNLSDYYNVTNDANDLSNSKFTLTGISEQPQLNIVLLNNNISSIEYSDKLGHLNKITLTDIVFNENIADDCFVFKTAPDIDIIEQ